VARKINYGLEMMKARTGDSRPDLGPEHVERVTRIELALSAWEAERFGLVTTLTW
jgi:hypothetical protein